MKEQYATKNNMEALDYFIHDSVVIFSKKVSNLTIPNKAQVKGLKEARDSMFFFSFTT